ncbi:MAG TPA: SDR family oxidoreductase [Ignavibacteria bacterium]|nr:SDR family oxidoreductase [Ignavibacteria bacterium]
MSNKVAVVTGGARRLGRDISIELGRAGYDVIIIYNKSKKFILKDTILRVKETGVNVTAIKCDISKVSDIKKMFRKVYEQYKRLDLLVNNASVFEHSDFFKITEKFFDKFVDTNLKGVFFCSQEAARIMLKSKKTVGKIINIASLGGIENWTGYIPYSLSRVGVIKLTKLLGKRLAPDILVNAIAPGTILIENDANDTVDFEEVKKYPMKRFANSGDIASMIIYLAMKNNYITGQTFIVDGGRSL